MLGGAPGNYEDLRVWRRAMDMVIEIYRVTKTFPTEELYGLTSQMRRAAVSIPSNIAEGKGRFSSKELTHFLFQARGSLMELRTQISLCRELNLLSPDISAALYERSCELGRLLNGLINRFQLINAEQSKPRNGKDRNPQDEA